MITFEESGMKFSFEEDKVYRIEKSSLVADIQLKATECVVSISDNLVFIEAKTSAPRPQTREDFDIYIQDITDKFADSIKYLNAVMLRHQEENLPEQIANKSLKQVKYSFVLIIKKHELSWLPPVSDALKSSMRHVLRLWNVPDVCLKVMNERMALDAGYCAK